MDFESWYGYLICKSKYGVKSAIASKQLYLNVVEDIDAKDVQHLLRYSLFYGHVWHVQYIGYSWFIKEDTAIKLENRYPQQTQKLLITKHLLHIKRIK